VSYHTHWSVSSPVNNARHRQKQKLFSGAQCLVLSCINLLTSKGISQHRSCVYLSSPEHLSLNNLASLCDSAWQWNDAAKCQCQ